MYCTQVLYPSAPGMSFDLDHYLSTHVPMGLGFLRSHQNLVPVANILETDIVDLGDPGAPAPFDCIASLYFEREDEAGAVDRLFEIPEVAAELRRDFDAYTSGKDPMVTRARLLQIDVSTHAATDEYDPRDLTERYAWSVKVIYPVGPSPFDFEHYFSTHVPLGQGLLKSVTGVAPKRNYIQVVTDGPTDDGPRFACIGTMFFDTKEDADAMVRLFDDEQAADALRRDFPNYTSEAPMVVRSRTIHIDPRTATAL